MERIVPNEEVSIENILERELAANKVMDQVLKSMLQDHAKVGGKMGEYFHTYTDTETKAPISYPSVESSIDKMRLEAEKNIQLLRSQGRTEKAEQCKRDFERILERSTQLLESKKTDPDTIAAFLSQFSVGYPINYYYSACVSGNDSRYEQLPVDDITKRHKGLKKFLSRKLEGHPEDQGDGPSGFVQFNVDKSQSAQDRIYISLDYFQNPEAALEAWWQALASAGLEKDIYYKTLNGIDNRLDSIVVYPAPEIDQEKLYALISKFREVCPRESLADQTIRSSATVLGRGIAYAPEWEHMTNMWRITTGKKDSYSGSVSHFIHIALQHAYKQLVELGTPPKRFSNLLELAHKNFQTFLEIADINPKTMIPYTRNSGQLPVWVERLKATSI